MPTQKNEPSALLVELTATHKNCRMCEILQALPTTEKDALLLVIKKMQDKNLTQHGRSQHSYSYSWLAGVLTKHGFAIEKKDVMKYFRKNCEC